MIFPFQIVHLSMHFGIRDACQNARCTIYHCYYTMESLLLSYIHIIINDPSKQNFISAIHLRLIHYSWSYVICTQEHFDLLHKTNIINVLMNQKYLEVIFARTCTTNETNSVTIRCLFVFGAVV